MPTYQYACTECSHRFEQVQSFSDDALTECPRCQGRLRKLFNAVGVVFKGSGFYRNDSREPATAAGSDAAAEKSSDKPSEKTTEKSTEKPADKPAEKKPAATSERSARPERSSTPAATTGGAARAG